VKQIISLSRRFRILSVFTPLLVFSVPSYADPTPIVVCYPGGPVNESDANNAMGAMLRVVERVGEWPAQSFSSRFTASLEECRGLLDAQNPKFAITSLGLFLEQQKKHHLIPLVQPVMRGSGTETYRLMSKPGLYKGLETLKGKRVGGTVFEEKDFIRKIVFAGQIDPAVFFELKPSRQAIRAIRSLDKDELDAVLLNGQQYAALDALNLPTPLEVVYTSKEIPLMGLVADEKLTTQDERARFAKALTAMCSDNEGKKLCELFGVDAFRPATEGTFNSMISLWGQTK
jgi:hypothetical protein